MEAFQVPFFRIESPADLPNIARAAAAAFDRGGPAATILGHYAGWE
jgi:hypothetical protein